MIGFYTVPEGERVAIWQVNGAVRYVNGPKRVFVLGQRIEPLERYAAEPAEYLVVSHKDGTAEHLPGPVTIWFDPVIHSEIAVATATKLDANEALVVYKHDARAVARRILRGPALYVPAPEEWIHGFSWHGTDARNGYRKIPNALQFTKIRIIPDQMYFDVDTVRTADDALIVMKVMVFFELVDIELMLDQTHDPIADFINALSADVIDFVGGYDFEAFKSQTEKLNELTTYPQLVQRAAKIGYTITKVVYRGYHATEKLQTMHDGAIECRTRLHLEAETERQAQELADMKLVREMERTTKRQQMEEAETRHTNFLHQLQQEAELLRLEAKQAQALEARRREDEQTLVTKQKQNEQLLEFEAEKQEQQKIFFARLHELQVDLTHYLVAQYQNPDKVIRIDQAHTKAQLHVHEN